MTRRHEDPECGPRHRLNHERAEAAGLEYFDQDSSWSQEDWDRALDGIIHHGWNFREFHQQMGRTQDAFNSILWKTATNYRERANYRPCSRVRRDGYSLSDQDKRVLDAATGKDGVECGADNLAHIAAVLGRSEEGLRRLLLRLCLCLVPPAGVDPDKQLLLLYRQKRSRGGL